MADLLCSYLSAAICDGRWGTLSWISVYEKYTSCVQINSPRKDYKIFQSDQKESSKHMNDDSWYLWANMFAETYGWDLEYIAELDIDDTISLIQEILYSEQVRKEWEWGLSEKSVSYDSRSKKSKFVPYKRPKWMEETQETVPAKPVKILRSMIPAGVIYGKTEDVKH